MKESEGDTGKEEQVRGRKRKEEDNFFHTK